MLAPVSPNHQNDFLNIFRASRVLGPFPILPPFVSQTSSPRETSQSHIEDPRCPKWSHVGFSLSPQISRNLLGSPEHTQETPWMKQTTATDARHPTHPAQRQVNSIAQSSPGLLLLRQMARRAANVVAHHQTGHPQLDYFSAMPTFSSSVQMSRALVGARMTT